VAYHRVMRGRRPLAAARLTAALVAVAIVMTGCAAPVASTSIAPPASAPGSAAPSGSPAPGADRPYRPTPAPAPTLTAYVVRAGDTLAALAARFGTTVDSLAYWNRARYPTLDPESRTYAPNRIEIGWRLDYVPGQVVDPENLPPAATPSGPAGSLEPFPVLPADGSAILVAHGPRGSDAVALTFEYGGGPGAGAPTASGADAVLQWLVARGVAATVFVAPAAADPADAAGQAVLGRLAAAPAGITPGLLPSPPGPGASWDTAVRGADARLAPLLGRSTAPWLRVSGALDTAALGVIGATGWRWVIGADVDPGDGIAPAAGGPIAADITARVVSRAAGGSIVHLALGGTHTLEALPTILDGLAANGLRVVSLSELLGVAAP
jgi:peptidoglycan/xylan/chitin deacetylase (PgdA/CDA1 family)